MSDIAHKTASKLSVYDNYWDLLRIWNIYIKIIKTEGKT